ncbi:MAG TPA: 3-isopropylmalate dehydratase small subunit [Acidimicrobiia bacterium]|nr:3-isopropylmalate dehydratase small subunit [Acidimicrobiia bacterium]
MEPVTQVVGTGVPLKRSDVDTDQIIPAVWLKRVERTGFGNGLFSAWREDPDFVLNRPEYKQGSILLAGPNFGCGSSREHAVWALEESGFYAVISSGFADIFRANSLKNGLLPVQIPEETVKAITDLVEKDPSTEIVIDVDKRTVSVASAGIETGFPLDDFARYRLMNGLDDIGLTMQRQDEIGGYEAKRPAWSPAINDR